MATKPKPSALTQDHFMAFGAIVHQFARHEYALANAGHDTRLIQDWLGHRAIQHTARYTELSPTRFKDVWR